MESNNFITSIPIKRSKERKGAEKESIKSEVKSIISQQIFFTRISFQIFDLDSYSIQNSDFIIQKMDLKGIYQKIHLHTKKNTAASFL